LINVQLTACNPDIHKTLSQKKLDNLKIVQKNALMQQLVKQPVKPKAFG
jgi:hypothetical protein